MVKVGSISDSERICFQNVVQRFRLIQERPDTLREAFAHLFRNRVSYHDFEALKGISFVMREGETVAIIGRNGSGKSTILKIIAGVYRPTSGMVKVSGKVYADRTRGGLSSRFDGPGEHNFERFVAGSIQTRDSIARTADSGFCRVGGLH